MIDFTIIQIGKPVTRHMKRDTTKRLGGLTRFNAFCPNNGQSLGIDRGDLQLQLPTIIQCNRPISRQRLRRRGKGFYLELPLDPLWTNNRANRQMAAYH